MVGRHYVLFEHAPHQTEQFLNRLDGVVHAVVWMREHEMHAEVTLADDRLAWTSETLKSTCREHLGLAATPSCLRLLLTHGKAA